MGFRTNLLRYVHVYGISVTGVVVPIDFRFISQRFQYNNVGQKALLKRMLPTSIRMFLESRYILCETFWNLN